MSSVLGPLFGYALCHPLPEVDGEPRIAFADAQARLAAGYMRGVLQGAGLSGKSGTAP